MYTYIWARALSVGSSTVRPRGDRCVPRFDLLGKRCWGGRVGAVGWLMMAAPATGRETQQGMVVVTVARATIVDTVDGGRGRDQMTASVRVEAVVAVAILAAAKRMRHQQLAATVEGFYERCSRAHFRPRTCRHHQLRGSAARLVS